MNLEILPTGNYNPALVDLEICLVPAVFPLAFPDLATEDIIYLLFC